MLTIMQGSTLLAFGITKLGSNPRSPSTQANALLQDYQWEKILYRVFKAFVTCIPHLLFTWIILKRKCISKAMVNHMKDLDHFVDYYIGRKWNTEHRGARVQQNWTPASGTPDVAVSRCKTIPQPLSAFSHSPTPVTGTSLFQAENMHVAFPHVHCSIIQMHSTTQYPLLSLCVRSTLEPFTVFHVINSILCVYL